MSHSLNSLTGGYIGDDIGDYDRVIEGDTWSLDYSSYDMQLSHQLFCFCFFRAFALRGSAFDLQGSQGRLYGFCLNS